jgi:hypothetical protein
MYRCHHRRDVPAGMIAEILTGATVSIQSDGEFHQVVVVLESREEAEALFEALEAIGRQRWMPTKRA